MQQEAFMNVVVIGSGLSGLTAAAHFSRAGHQVTIFEQHDKIGGVTATIEQGGYRWEWGQMMVSELGPGERGGRILDDLGIADKLSFIPAYKENSFPDFHIRRPCEYAGADWRRRILKQQFPEDARGLERYYRLYERVHDLVALGEQSGFRAKMRLFTRLLPILGKLNWSAERLMNHYFTRKELHAVFLAMLADYVIRPGVFPALAVPMINAESQYDERVPLIYGRHESRQSWKFILGGWGRLVDVLAARLQSTGGRVETGIAVEEILVDDTLSPRATGVRLADGRIVDADVVIVSGGAKELYGNLVDRRKLPESFLRKYVDDISLTESVFMVHLGVDYDPTVHQNNAALCYYYLTYDIDGSIDETLQGEYHEGRHGFLAYVPSKFSSEMAPPGHHAITIYTIAPSCLNKGTWEERKDEFAEKLLDIAERKIPGLREHETLRIVTTPDDFMDRTYLHHHAFGGAVPTVGKAPPPHESPIKGLWFVGAQSASGGGVVNAMIGATETFRKVVGREA